MNGVYVVNKKTKIRKKKGCSDCKHNGGSIEIKTANGISLRVNCTLLQEEVKERFLCKTHKR